MRRGVGGGRPAPGRPPLRSPAVTLDEVQALMERLFGADDRARGVAATVAWLCEELGELAQAVRKGTPEQQLHELGDLLAWTASLANQLGLSLDDAMRRYEHWPSAGT
jgi:NTP pyrophosphatase (non-canonical NTP hydrolase)